MAETVNQETNGTAAETQENEQRTFTQAEMNAIIQDRLTRERGKYADYEALKAKAAKFDAAEEAGKTELQKANEKADALQKQVDAFTKAEQLRTVRQKVSAATGVPAELLSGDTEETCTAQANAILKFAKPNRLSAVKDGGEHGARGGTESDGGSGVRRFKPVFENLILFTKGKKSYGTHKSGTLGNSGRREASQPACYP